MDTKNNIFSIERKTIFKKKSQKNQKLKYLFKQYKKRKNNY